MKVCHLTSVHPRNDIRIFHKECCSLARTDYNVNFIVADGKPDEIKNNVNIISVPKIESRVKRIIKTPYLVYKKALEVDADIYHFHDPELLPIGIKLKKRGKKVIYDSHENVERQLLSKPYIHLLLRSSISKIFALYERYAVTKFDLVITATPNIRNKFNKIHHNVLDINNYPILNELKTDRNIVQKSNSIAYIGGITEIRGIKQLVRALEYCKTDVRLKLAGEFNSESFRNEIIQYEGWKRVDELGFLDRNMVQKLLSEVQAGTVLYLPLPNHIEAQPNKMFEYMSASVPVIASNYPLWKTIIEGEQCGICVDPTNPKLISQAIDWIFENPDDAQIMGDNGLKAIKKYNWNNEEKKLLKGYKNL